MPTLAAIVSALHVLALAIGLPAIFLRSRALRGTLDRDGLRRVFVADGAWGLAAILWLVTGLLRAFGSMEKGTAFYMGTWLFHLKLGLFVLVVALEVAPMVGLMRWRRALARGKTPDLGGARLYARLSHAEMGIVIVMVFVAAFMARGFGRLG